MINDEPSNSQSSFESLKKVNQHGVEYWSARDLQSLLGYTQWRRFENALKKAIESCKQSNNNPDHHFAGAGNPIVGGKGVVQNVDKISLQQNLLKMWKNVSKSQICH